MPDSRAPRFRGFRAIAIVLVVVAMIVAAARFLMVDDEAEVAADDDTSSPTSPLDIARKRPIDSGKLMLDANKASVSGTVRDSNGTPIAGANVCAQANQAELLGAGDRLPQCRKSERDGHYRLDGLWPVSTAIHASAPQFVPQRFVERVDGRERGEIRLHAGEERREIDITLERGGVPIRGVVKDIGGGVVEDALVIAGSSGFGALRDAIAVARTDADGRFELWWKSGETALAANAEGYAPARTTASAPTELATIFMTPESVLAGIVVHVGTSTPVAGVTVRASGGNRGETITDAEGRFRIAALTPGNYDVEAQADELYGESAVRIPLGLAQSVDDIVVEVHPAFAVAGKIMIAETGAPCTSGNLLLIRDGTRYADAVDERGEVLARALLPGEYEVQISCEGHIAEPEYAPIVIVDQSLVELEWKVHTGLSIRGVVVDSNAAPVVGIRVFASPKASDDPRARQTTGFTAATLADGTFELQGLLSGSYEVDVWSDRNDYPNLAQPEPVTLGESDVDGLRLVLPATGRLVGIVRDEAGVAMPGITVQATSLERGRGSQGSTRTGDDGRFEIPRLEAGSYRVLAQINWFNEMRAPGTTDDDIQGEVVEIVAGGEVELALVVESRALGIRGRVVDSTGAPVSDAFIDAARMSDSAAAGSGNPQSMRWGWDRKPVLSDHDGNFELADLSEGEYVVHAYRGGGGEGTLEGVAAGSTGIVLTIVDTGQIAGKVVLASGASPERFDVVVSDVAKGLRRGDDFFRTNGIFAIRELPPGSYEVRVTAAQGSVKTEVVLVEGESIEDLTLELTGKVTVNGRLVDADTRTPVPGMEVRISAASGFSFGGTSGKQDHVSDADGRFRVENVEVGKVQIMVSPRNATDSAYGWNTRHFNLPSEPAVQDIGEIELLPRRTKLDEAGGDIGYKLAQLDPKIEPEDKYFEVAVIRPGGPAANTELAVGDRIVEVDGRSVSGLDSHRYSTLTHAPPGTSITLGIEGGKQVTIVLGQPIE